jgi:radical SAM protein with 4Fe4S-binding SPASM domain
MSLSATLDKILSPFGAHRRARDLAPGIYSYQVLEGDWPTRFHLRVNGDESGLLLANAAESAHLSPVGTRLARDVLEGRGDEEIIADLRAAFHGAGRSRMAEDLAAVRQLIANLAAPGDNYPVSNLADQLADQPADARLLDGSPHLAAPFRADLMQGPPEQMRQILRRLWEAGIPHVTFLARPDAPPEDLPLLVEAAGDLGMLTGLRAVASWVSLELIQRTALAGLDHLDLLYVCPEPEVHDALAGAGDHARALAAFEQVQHLELAAVAQVPLYAHNTRAELGTVFSTLHAAGVTNLSFFALACPDDDAAAQAAGALPARALPQIALTVTEAAERNSARYIWCPPVRFDPARSLAAQILAGPRTEGDGAVRVEADGRVKPARGPSACAGNLLTDAWSDLWNHDCFARYRERLAAPTRCADCPDLAICAADCPKDPAGWSDDRGEVESRARADARESEVESERTENADGNPAGGEE